MERRSTRRVSFHKEVTVKEFIKANSGNDDIQSPDLYHAPINHTGHEMDVSHDSDMELTATLSDSDLHPQGPSDSDLPSEFTVMISRDMECVNYDDTLSKDEITQGEITGSVNRGENTMSLMDRTLLPSSPNLINLAKSTLSAQDLDNFIASKKLTSGNDSTLDESVNSTLRRSRRIANLSSETPIGKENTPVLLYPEVRLHQSSVKNRSIQSSVRPKREKKKVSLINRSNSESTAALTFSDVTDIALVDTSSESSKIIESMDFSSNSVSRIEELRARRDSLKQQLMKKKNVISELENELRLERQRIPHPDSIELMKLIHVI